MGSSTVAFLRKCVKEEDVVAVLSEKYGSKIVLDRVDRGCLYINFNDGERDRSLFFVEGKERGGDFSGPWVSLGCFGKSVEIIKGLCEAFGGYIDEDDCDDKDYYVVNFEGYKSSPLYNQDDELKHSLFVEHGYDEMARRHEEIVNKQARENHN
jgi:hypothetical protein